MASPQMCRACRYHFCTGSNLHVQYNPQLCITKHAESSLVQCPAWYQRLTTLIRECVTRIQTICGCKACPGRGIKTSLHLLDRGSLGNPGVFRISRRNFFINPEPCSYFNTSAMLGWAPRRNRLYCSSSTSKPIERMKRLTFWRR